MIITRRLPPLGLQATTAPAPPVRADLAGQCLRVIARAAGLALWTAPASAVQAVLIALPGDAKRGFARIYWSGVCRILGVERRVVGARCVGAGRPVLFVSNHTSWLDVPTLGATLPACFVAKAEVGQWPVIRTIARLGRTVFVSRRARETGRERDDMRARLAAGDNLILFPEGTSSDGARVLPFRSPFFSVAETRAGETAPLIQPVSTVYDRLEGLPIGRATRPVPSWYGDMDLGRHFWRLARFRHLRVTIVLHPPLDPAEHPSRKALARAVWTTVASAAAGLRQNRPPVPAATLAAVVSLDRPPAVPGTIAAG